MKTAARNLLIASTASVILALSAIPSLAQAPVTQYAGPSASSFGTRLFTPASPSLSATLFGGGVASEDIDVTDEGLQLEQSVTEGFGLVGRVTGYQLYITKNASSPLEPSSGAVARVNFARLQGGVDLHISRDTQLVLLGGHDVGDSDAWIVEGDLSTWFYEGPWPINLFITPQYNFQNKITSSEIDILALVKQTPDWDLLLGAGGSVYGGGFIHGVDGQGGPMAGIYLPNWQLGANLQVGYGSVGVYGLLTVYKTFTFPGL